ncbi:glycoside hydrolase family 3 protein [Alteromonas flava]|uniref:glycoside hydrolase family 3 protein n=1 Tax=Alteromonas flava TaxID=2048003 RepID=UPI0013DB9BDE|nr:glycoside hydrolase family 3 protein [Alteromonas flava]
MNYRQQAEAMVKKLTLEQKIGQMTLADQSTCTVSDVTNYKLGGVMSSAGSCPEPNSVDSWVGMIDGFWDAALAVDEAVKIPLLYGLDAIHGNANVQGATIFPHNIGIGATASATTIKNLAAITADEVRAIGANWIFGPNLAMAHHYHWGRMYESVSAEPNVTSDFARTYIGAINEYRNDYPLLACAKHFVGDGGTAHGIEQGDMLANADELERHVAPFSAAIDAGVLCIMVAFSSWNGEKCHSNRYLIEQKLKRDLGFNGFVLSDMQGVNYVDDDLYKAVGQSVNAGIDMFMVPQNWRNFQELLTKHIELGSVSINRIDEAVSRILTAKLARGLFSALKPSERCVPYRKRFGSPGHRAAAKEAAVKSCVLLKNDNDCLPLQAQQRLLITGRGASHTGMQCGGFTIDWQGVDAPNGVQGATSIARGLQQYAASSQTLSPEEVKKAETLDFDVAVVVLGERPYAEGIGDIRPNDQVLLESSSRVEGNLTLQPPYGRSLALCDLHPEDGQLIQAIAARGIPIVTVLLSGRPLIIDQEFALSQAFIAAWLPGSEGDCIADLLYAKREFSGRLPFAWPTESAVIELPLINNSMPYRERWPRGHSLVSEKLTSKRENTPRLVAFKSAH